MKMYEIDQMDDSGSKLQKNGQDWMKWTKMDKMDNKGLELMTTDQSR